MIGLVSILEFRTERAGAQLPTFDHWRIPESDSYISKLTIKIVDNASALFDKNFKMCDFFL